MELSPLRSIPSSPIKNLPNKRNELIEIIININKNIKFFKEGFDDATKNIKNLEEQIDKNKKDLEENMDKYHQNYLLKNLEKNADIDKKKLEEYKDYKEFYSDMLTGSEKELQIISDLLKEINTEIAKIDKISPLNKNKRSRSLSRSNNEGTKKKTRQNRRKSVHNRRH